MRYAALLIALLSFPAVADDVPPMPPEVRARFDAAMSKLWHADCECWRFVSSDGIREISPPLTEGQRWAILELIRRGAAVPIGQGKSKS